MSLATLQDYLMPWHLPFLFAYVLLFVILGTYLAKVGLRRILGLSKLKASSAAAAKAHLSSNFPAMLTLGILCGFVYQVSQKGGTQISALVAGGVVGLLAMFAMAWAINFLVLNAPAGKVLKFTLLVTGSMTAILLVMGVGVGLFTYSQRQETIKEIRCQREHVIYIQAALDSYAEKNLRRQAYTLQELLDKKLLESPDVLTCPGRPDRPIGYLYARCEPALPGTRSDRIRLADRFGNHPGQRTVLFNDGRLVFVIEKDFEPLLAQPQNADMAKLDQADRAP